MSYKTPKTIDTYPFGHVEAPIQVNTEEGRMETFIQYDCHDLAKLLEDLSWRYLSPFRNTNRQTEISDLARKLSGLVKREKSIKGQIWSPIILKKTDDTKADT